MKPIKYSNVLHKINIAVRVRVRPLALNRFTDSVQAWYTGTSGMNDSWDIHTIILVKIGLTPGKVEEKCKVTLKVISQHVTYHLTVFSNAD